MLVINETSKQVCVFPSGYYSEACSQLGDAIYAISTYTEGIAPCNISLDEDLSGVIHLASDCDCDTMPVYSVFGVTITGYKPQPGPVFVANYPASSPYGS
jgi:hypothetical protein